MKLWIPGPTQVRPEVLAELARPAIGHRSAAMVEVTERLDPHLRLAFGLGEDSTSRVAVHSTSASGMMEAALTGVGPRVLALVNGAFSKRFADIAEVLGKEVVRLEVPMGQRVAPEEVARALAEQGPFDAVSVVSSETSTGTATPFGPMGEVLAPYPNTMLLTDVVSWVAAAPIDFDRNRVDFAFAGVQKALALPPGIAVCCVSERYMEQARGRTRRSWYHDPVRIVEGHEARKTPATPAIPHYFALARQLEDITAGVTLAPDMGPAEGAAAWQKRFDEHGRMQCRTIEWAESHGLGLLPEPRFGSPGVGCIRAEGLDVAALVDGLKARGFQISNGYGDLKGKTFRIGHMGDHTLAGLEELLAAADELLPARVD